MFRKVITFVLVALVVAVAYFGLSYIWPTNLGDRVVSVIVEPGTPFSLVAEKLLDDGVVKSRAMLYIPARFRNIDKKLTPGRYDFTGKNSCRSVLDKLERADFVKVKVTIYEGAPLWVVASVLAHKMGVDSATVTAFRSDTTFLAEMQIPSLEGYLFPETYFFPWGMDVRDMLAEMVAMHKSMTDSVRLSLSEDDMSYEDVVILASIVEAEALLEEEKPRIASVYLNRLSRNMKLDADPTVIYGLGGIDRPLTKRDLKTKTPYNTYVTKGLPPTPINSPGLTAIKAVLNPEETDYLYFVADGSGGHRFSRTNAEHNRAKREIKRAAAGSS